MKPAPATTSSSSRTCGPGRPKDPEKRAAILAAAKQLFPDSGFEGTSMDAIAAEAGVSKLTVYSHFQDKETMFMAAIRERCEEQMPEALFEMDLRGPVRRQLEAIGHAFFTLVTAPESIALHRLLAASSPSSAKLAQLYWEAGPQRLQAGFQAFLRQEVAAGQLVIADVARAAAQFFCLLKGEWHARLLCGCPSQPGAADIDAHLQASVDLFLRAYGAPASTAAR